MKTRVIEGAIQPLNACTSQLLFGKSSVLLPDATRACVLSCVIQSCVSNRFAPALLLNLIDQRCEVLHPYGLCDISVHAGALGALLRLRVRDAGDGGNIDLAKFLFAL